MRVLHFPKSCVVCCKKCHHDVPAGTNSFPPGDIFVVCPLCGEKRKYLRAEVLHGRPHFLAASRKYVAREASLRMQGQRARGRS
jgi:hypothetical protein